MNNKGGYFKRKRINYAQVSNVALRDKNLSLKAKGLYALIQSYITIEDFILYKNYLMAQCKEGRDSFQTCWNELKKSGYLIQYKIQSEDGKFYYEYDLLDEPSEVLNESEKPDTENPHMDEKPYTDFPDVDSPGVENTPHINKTNKNKTNKNKTDIKSSSSEDEEDDDLSKIMKYCQSVEYKLPKAKAKALLISYDYTKIIKAIAHIIASDVKVTNYSGYLSKTLADLNSTKVVNINTTVENKRGFNNFKGREVNLKEYDELEKKLLGWD